MAPQNIILPAGTQPQAGVAAAYQSGPEGLHVFPHKPPATSNWKQLMGDKLAVKSGQASTMHDGNIGVLQIQCIVIGNTPPGTRHMQERRYLHV